MKVACIWTHHLPAKMELYRHPDLATCSIILAYAFGSQRFVFDVFPEIPSIVPHMPLQPALGLCRSAVLLEADISYYQKAHQRILIALEQRGAEVMEAGLGIFYMRIDGLEPMHGGEARLITSMLNAFPPHLMPHMGIGSGKFLAYLAASKSEPGGAVKLLDGSEELLSSFSVDFLPISREIRNRLHRFGLHTLGQVVSIPLGPLQAQFGSIGKLIWNLANGIDQYPLAPRHIKPEVKENIAFPSPIASFDSVITAAEILLTHAFQRVEMRGRLARICSLEGEILRSSTWTHRMSFKRPIGSPQDGLKLLTNSLMTCPPSGSLEGLSLTLSGLIGDAGRQESLFYDARRGENLREALDQLEARLGKRPPIFRMREVEPWSRIPERRRALVPFVP